MLDSIAKDIRYAFRTLAGRKVYSFTIILSLALGLGANAAIFTVLNAVLLKFLPVRDPQQIVQLRIREMTSFTNPIWEQIRDRQDVFEGAFAWGNARFNLNSGGEAQYARGSYVSGDTFNTLGVKPHLGRLIERSDDRRRGGDAGPVAVLNYGFWQDRFGGDPNVLGKQIKLDNFDFTIIGVLPPGFYGMSVGQSFDVAVPLGTEQLVRGAESALDHRSYWWMSLYARLKPGVSFTQANARVDAISPAIFEATLPDHARNDHRSEYRSNRLNIEPAAAGSSSLRSNYSKPVLFLQGVAIAVLLLACANLANLQLARASSREREVAIRFALGAGRSALIRQLMIETGLLVLAGAVAAIGVAMAGSRWLVSLLSTSRAVVYLDLMPDWRFIAGLAFAALVCTFLIGLAPAFKSTSVSPITALRQSGKGQASTGRFSAARLLTVVQVAICLILVATAALFLRSFSNLITLDAGYNTEGILVVSTDLSRVTFAKERLGPVQQDLLNRFAGLPGTVSAAQTAIVPISGGVWNNDLDIDGFVPRSRRDSMSNMNRVSARFFETLGQPLRSGRLFQTTDTAQSPAVAIVNETFAKRFFAGKDPLGRVVRGKNPRKPESYEIVGIVRDAKYSRINEPTPPTLYLSASQETEFRPSGNFSYFVRYQGDENAMRSAIKEQVSQVNPGIVLNFRNFAVQVSESLQRERMLASVSTIFGALALIIAMVGLYGVLSNIVSRRRAEIGIRIALGAAPRAVLAMMMRQAAILVAAGVIIGLAASLAITRLAESLLFEIKPNDPLTIATAVALVCAIALCASWLPARRAAAIDPMQALREE